MAKSAAPVRASGRTTADEIAEDEAKNGLTPVEPVGDPVQGGLSGGTVTRPEDKSMSMTPAFSRMRTDWNSPDRETIRQMKDGAEVIIRNAFGDVYDIFYKIYLTVREPEVNIKTGEIETDNFGVPKWKIAPGTNTYVEDWSRIGHREREEFLYRITTGLFRWTQVAADMWGEAMFTRAAFEEAFAGGYEEIQNERATIDDRTARARRLSADYRYHAVYASYLSRRADAVVRSAELLGQRLKDLTI